MDSDPSIRALVVTNSQYDSPNLGKLHGPAYDGILLSDVLEELGEAEVDRMPEHTASQVKDRVALFLRSFQSSETALLYFSCHGFRVDDRLWLAARDTRLDRLDTTAIEASWVRRQLHGCAAGAKVWILDCCHAAAGARDRHEKLFKGIDRLPAEPEATKGAARPASPKRQGRGLAILAAASDSQKALDGRKGSRYTRALVQGLRTGDADLDRDGWVSADELAHYVHDLLDAELGELADEIETRHFIEDAAGRIRLTRVARVTEPVDDGPGPVDAGPGPVDAGPGAVGDPAEEKDETPFDGVPDESGPLRRALHDPGGPLTAAVLAALVGVGILLAKENGLGSAVAGIAVGLLAYVSYVFVVWFLERARGAG